MEEENQKLKEEILCLNRKLQDLQWASQKTNEGIRILYKDLERKNQELQKLDQLKSDFVSTVSHELRTPLTTMREAVCLLLDGVVGQISQDQREILTICLNDIDRLKRIIDNLLDISKIEAGKIKLERRLTDIVDVIKGVSAFFAPRFKSRGLDLKISLPAQLEVYIDRDKIIQVLNNLVGNALKFAEKGQVEIALTDKGDYLECRVCDTGKGIAEDDLPKVFGKFQQFGRTAGPGEKGTGLGLAICKGIIEMHKGDIWVESALGEGTKFIFSLPKLHFQDVFRECLDREFKRSVSEGEHFSIIRFGIRVLEKEEPAAYGQSIEDIFTYLEESAQSHLCRKDDCILRSSKAVFIALPGINKGDAAKVKERIEAIARNYLEKHALLDTVQIVSALVVFPEDGAHLDELIAKLENSKNLG
jgi:signal transduction histidine kinase